VEPDPEVERLLTRDVAARLREIGEVGDVAFRAVLGLGRIGDHLLRVADIEQADVIVTGTHQRRGLARLGSVAGVVLHYSHASVACVPQPREPEFSAQQIPSIRRVLVTTDLSPLANAAVPYGYALLHVLPMARQPTASPAQAEIVAQLRRLEPAGAMAHRVVTHIEAVQRDDVARAICEAAERLGVDAICMASHGRTGLVRSLLGSVAESVLRQSRRPVFIIRSWPT
jgi:nucleotide-binding universal stress UspA family protein